MSAAAPLAAGRVAATRASVVTVIACVAGIVVSPLTTLDPHEAVAWLLPALALSVVSVAIATYVDSPSRPSRSGSPGWRSWSRGWACAACLRGLSVDGLATDRPGVQAALLVATAAAIAVCFVRRDSDPNWRTLP